MRSAKREAHLPKEHWAKPRSNWLPLRQAVFTFGIGSKNEDQHLIEILREKSGADSAEILRIGDPQFLFIWNDGAYGGTPWEILAEPAGGAFIVDRDSNAEMPAKLNGRYQAARAATSLVWNQFIVPKFDHAVSIGTVILYGRPQTLMADFEQLPADVWPMFDVTDWKTGAAVSPGNTACWSIHAAASSEEPVPAATAGDENAAIKALAAQFKENAKLTRAEAAAWCVEKKFTLSKRGFQFRVWPKAREIAGLPATAQPGRKSLR
jgi:hypothetical protein